MRLATVGGLIFTVLFVVHRLLQGTGPDGSSPTAVAAYYVEHRGALSASEFVVGLGLLAFIAFLAPLVAVGGRLVAGRVAVVWTITALAGWPEPKAIANITRDE